MDREAMLESLAAAERHIAAGELLVERQLELIAELEDGGHDTRLANELLSVLEQSQSHHLADRERIRAELQRNQISIR